MNGIIDKIKKLLSLATSDNQNEAELASKKAQELLIKHNLEKADIKEAPEYNEKREAYKRANPALKFIHPLLTEYYFVYMYRHTSRSPFIDNEYVMVGTKENIEIAGYVRSFLLNSFKQLYKIENKKQNWKGKYRDVFYYGLYEGLKEQLEAQRKAIDTEGALVPINEALVRHVESQHKLSHRRRHVNGSNEDARAAGQEAGRNLKISRGITTQSSGSATNLLGGK